MSEHPESIVVLITAPNHDEATTIAELLVSSKLAACVQLLPQIQSIYIWNNQIERDTEVLLLAKSTRTHFAELEAAVRAIHSYETPEIVALPIVAGSEAYLDWLNSSLDGS